MEKILFKTKDIGTFFGMQSLVKTILSDESKYQKGVDYVIVSESLNDQRSTVDRDFVCLTYQGFICVIFVSSSGNENRSKMVSWSLRILYAHQLGSDEERCDVASDLLKVILNLKLCGLYFVDFDRVSDLYETMGLNKTEYPPESYGPYRIGKLGLSEDFPQRYKNLKSHYGRYTPNVNLKWILLVPKGCLDDTERRLLKLVDGYAMSCTSKNTEKS
ncbi:hypothetical protein L915_14360 [Phytophthora nicotianae]|uniref:Uncharacterized protein n=1 Tax=Phytophthora nicotianae TaxID=4792 RepID=W2G9P3_PHYNI|nr:hypothetical protein L915_14360 [Phytophthora nicotianae]